MTEDSSYTIMSCTVLFQYGLLFLFFSVDVIDTKHFCTTLMFDKIRQSFPASREQGKWFAYSFAEIFARY
jgi:hypothetical protein